LVLVERQLVRARKGMHLVTIMRRRHARGGNLFALWCELALVHMQTRDDYDGEHRCCRRGGPRDPPYRTDFDPSLADAGGLCRGLACGGDGEAARLGGSIDYRRGMQQRRERALASRTVREMGFQACALAAAERVLVVGRDHV